MLLILGAFLTSCDKDKKNFEQITVTGYVQDYQTGDSIPDCTVELWEAKTPRGNDTIYFDKIIARGTSDETGRFSIDFSGNSQRLYGLRAIKPNYFVNKSLDSFSLGGNVKPVYNVNTGISPYSWTRLEIRNLPPVQPTDTFNFDDVVLLTGQIDTVIYIPYAKLFTRDLYHWDIITGEINERTYFSPSTCPTFDTCVYTIHF